MQQLLDDDVEDPLAVAEERFGSGAARLAHPLLAPARLLPWIGRQLRSATALATSARDATGMARSAIVRIDDAVGDGVPAGADRPAVLADVAATATRLRDGLAGLDLGPDDALAGALTAARTEFEHEIDDLTGRLDTLIAVASGVGDLLEGPHRYSCSRPTTPRWRTARGCSSTTPPSRRRTANWS